MLRLIAAIDSMNGLATDNGIPWDLPTDKSFFYEQCQEGLILMGSGTYREFEKPLHGRTNYVVTSHTGPLKNGFETVNDIGKFLRDHNEELIQNIGGAGIYEAALPYADELILTRVDGDFGCTKFFPSFEQDFKCTSRSETYNENGIGFMFETWRPKSLKH